MSIGFHPVCLLFPPMTEADLNDLAEDIKTNGQDQEIMAWNNQICDGRNRYLACKIAGVDPRIKHLTDEPSVQKLVSLNLKRRHLTESQRAMLATELLPFFEAEAEKRKAETQFKTNDNSNGSTVGTNVSPPQKQGKSAKKAADSVGVGQTSVKRAKKVKDKSPELAAKVLAGEVSVAAAAKQVDAPPEPEIVRDPLGIPVPAYLLPVFDGLALFKEADGLCRKLQDVIEKLSTNPAGVTFRRELETSSKGDGAMRHRHKSLQQLKTDLKLSRPYTRCPYCASRESGKAFKDCKTCRGFGWATKVTFDGAPADYRAAVEKTK